jgi:di/tricarboxylate transporter
MPETQIILVLVVAAGAVFLFVTEKVRIDVTALIVLVALLGLRLVRPAQTLYGFANPATGTVASMFVLSAGLGRTGLIDWLARWLDRLAGDGERRLVLILCVAIAVISTVVVNTATVAIFLPVAMVLAKRRKIAESRVLMPLSFASQFGGVCTLVGTSTNILVNSIAVSAGLAAFGLFEFARLGIVMACLGVVYLVIAGKWLLPRRRGAVDRIDKYRLSDYLAEFRVAENSSMIDKTWEASEAAEAHEIRLIKIIRDEKAIWQPKQTPIEAGDILLVHGDADRLIKMKDHYNLETRAEEEMGDQKLSSDEIRLVEALVPPQSNFVGRSIAGAYLPERFGCTVLAAQRRGRALRRRLGQVRLAANDSLLLQCDIAKLPRILRSPNLIVTSELTELSLRKEKALLALMILGGVLALTAAGVIPILFATLIGAVAMVLTGCLNIEEAYHAIDWKIIFLLGGILPLGLALETSGAAAWITERLLGRAMTAGPLAVLAVLYLTTAVLTEAMSNNAAAVLLAPIAISVAGIMDIDPRPLLVAITFAASTSFATPVGYQTNTMVYAPGGYRFSDFSKLGIPLNLLFWALAVLLIPRFWPF